MAWEIIETEKKGNSVKVIAADGPKRLTLLFRDGQYSEEKLKSKLKNIYKTGLPENVEITESPAKKLIGKTYNSAKDIFE